MTGSPSEYGKAIINLLLIAGITWFAIVFLPTIIVFFLPFIFGWFLAVILSPVVRFLEVRLKVKRKAGAFLVMISALGGVGFAVYVAGAKVTRQAVRMGNELPEMLSLVRGEFLNVRKQWSGVMKHLPREVTSKMEEIAGHMGRQMGDLVGELSMPSADEVGEIAKNLPGFFMAMIMCLLSTYFFLSEKDGILAFAKKYFPPEWGKKVLLLKETTADVMAGYVKAQLKIEIWIYLLLVAGFMILKIKNGYLVAVFIAFLDMLPLFGTGIVLVPWAVFKALNGQYMFALGLLVIWGAGQLVRQMIQPKVIGDSMGIAPLPALILLYTGYQLAGITGMIVAVPFGMLVAAMNEAGFFENSKTSIRILWCAFQSYRKSGILPKGNVQGNSRKEETETEDNSVT